METKKIARMGMLVAVAFVLSWLEAMLPLQVGIPGVKLGLSNIVVMLCLYSCSVKESLGIALLRIVLVGFTFGSLSTMLYSMAGGMLSFVIMVLLKRTDKFSVYGVSVAGGVCHNIGQILVALAVLHTSKLIYYLPVLMLSGCVAGVLIGFVAGALIKRLEHLFREDS